VPIGAWVAGLVFDLDSWVVVGPGFVAYYDGRVAVAGGPSAGSRVLSST
jgi:hypothetical protein